MASLRPPQCPSCGNIYLADSDFCRHCGEKREDFDPFRQFCSEVISNASENLCLQYEREIQQLTTDLVNCRSQLSRCAELLTQQLDKEKTYRDIIQKLSESSLRVLQAQPPSLDESMKQQMHQMLEAMHVQNASLFEDGFGQLHQHKALAETHLMTSSELQNQGEAVRHELENILAILKEPPVRSARFELPGPQAKGSTTLALSQTPAPQVTPSSQCGLPGTGNQWTMPKQQATGPGASGASITAKAASQSVGAFPSRVPQSSWR
mmetsp:Transcript_117077/g.278109  ORF Transcript_117077/g.278109 Transcript_117077/m.278109 type:complete len:265 (+) Transcript_117077:71-865(+)